MNSKLISKNVNEDINNRLDSVGSELI